jgi:hypothetical protein
MTMGASDSLLTMPANNGFAIITYIKALGTTMRTTIEIGVKRDDSINRMTSKTLSLGFTSVYLEGPDKA